MLTDLAALGRDLFRLADTCNITDDIAHQRVNQFLEVVGAVLGKNDVCLLHDGLKLDRHFNADGQVLIIKHRYQGLGV